MPAERTLVTELATGLGTLGFGDIDDALERRPAALANVSDADFSQLQTLRSEGKFDLEFATAFDNGQSFLASRDALNGRRPRIVEWTGGRKAPGDETVPADLRIDHVYMVSCKYLSDILHNVSPSRLVDCLISRDATPDRANWYERVAPTEFQRLYEIATNELDLAATYPAEVGTMTRPQRKVLAKALAGSWSPAAKPAYRKLCERVSEETAERWSASITASSPETVSWRLLRIGSAPYFVLGASKTDSMRLRIATPWDVRERFDLRTVRVSPEAGGQPRVSWTIEYIERSTGRAGTVDGHVEVRWSHGRFGQPPEAKVYLDVPHAEVPGYFALSDHADG